MNCDAATANEIRGSGLYVAPSAICGIDSQEFHKTSACLRHLGDDASFLAHDEDQHNVQLEAVEMEGRWFALDRDQLEFYQRLERDGGCRSVRVEPVSLTQLSDEVRTKIVESVASIKNGALPVAADSPVIQGYQMLKEEGKVEKASSDSLTDIDHQSDSTQDDDLSSSECGSHYLDWSEDEGDSSDEKSEEEEEEEEDVDQKQRTLADGKSDTSSDENEQLLGEES